MPELAPSGSTEQVRQIVPCGGTMYAVGKFTAIEKNGVTNSVNVISFSATSLVIVRLGQVPLPGFTDGARGFADMIDVRA
jgi:hypothetical protein